MGGADAPLGYSRYVAQGGDVGAGVTDAMSRQAPDGLLGIHMNLLVTALGGGLPATTDEEPAALAAIKEFQATGSGYLMEQATPQTIGYALLDSPVAQAAWMLDHDTDSYNKISRAFVEGQPTGNLTRDHILDNITLYWLTGTGVSARSYWENARAQAAGGGQVPPPVTVPVGFTTFPGEIFQAPRSWVELSYPTLTYFHEVERGGHFAAWEEPRAVRDRNPGGVPAAAPVSRLTPDVSLWRRDDPGLSRGVTPGIRFRPTRRRPGRAGLFDLDELPLVGPALPADSHHDVGHDDPSVGRHSSSKGACDRCPSVGQVVRANSRIRASDGVRQGSQLVGYGMSHPNGGTLLTLRLDPEQAAKTAGWVYFEMGVPDTVALKNLAERLDGLDVRHGPMARTPVGWLLPGVFDPDGHEMRFYVSEPQEPVDPQHPIRIHNAGPGGWSERIKNIDLGELSTT